MFVLFPNGFDLRCSILWAKRTSVLIAWSINVKAVGDFIPQIFVDGAGLVADFDLPEPRHPEEEILIVDETLILWQALVVVPDLPVHAVKEGPLSELQSAEKLGL